MDRYKQTLDLCLIFKLWLILGRIRYTTADCSVSTPGVQTFGTECQFMCHCKDGASCNSNTGECDKGCASNWYGPACQYRDLAEGQFSRHAGNINPPKYSSLAHDGDISTCSYTKTASTASSQPWWRIWFSRNETIREIYLKTTESGLQYLANGYEVTVEYVPESRKNNNNYSPPTKQTCFKYDGGQLDSKHIHVKCGQPLVGNHVRIKLSTTRSQLSLCDVRINGGRNFAFRKTVSSNSQNSEAQYQPSNAVDGRIPTTGLTGCFASSESVNKNLDIDLGRLYNIYSVNISKNIDVNIEDYKMYDRTVVPSMLLHDDTNNQPPVTYIHLNRDIQQLRIEKNTGNYLDICEVQLFGECLDNRCGYDCSEKCYCSSSIEDMEQRISGVCTTGCLGRWTGTDGKCNIECDETKWGTSCQSDCGACRSGPCDVIAGYCSGGCQDGFYNDNWCLTECQDGLYGFNCALKCSEHCKSGKCFNTNGDCVDGCEPGYTGDKCDNKCPEKTYGDKCSQTCNTQCIDVCNHVNGTCKNCRAGWKGDFCDEDCEDGTYGIGCEQICIPNCLTSCDKADGSCTRCKHGWMGTNCDTECRGGLYGINCEQECSDHCVDTCNKETGSCNCTAGWQGTTCHNQCDDGTHGDGCSRQCGNCKEGSACDKINGNCIAGCAAGYEGSLCVRMIKDEDQSSVPVAAIAGAVSAAVVIAIGVVVAVLILRRRKKSATKNQSKDDLLAGKEKKWTTVSSDDSKSKRPSSKKDSNIYENTAGLLGTAFTSDDEPPCSSSSVSVKNETNDSKGYYEFDDDLVRPQMGQAIKLNELAKYVKSRLAVENFFEKEFQDIPYGLQYPTLEARRPENIGKNRYKAMYAYDHSRVKLKTLSSDPQSDYINASYIKGYAKDRAYIAAQGPTVNNIEDFWRMIWENDVHLIAMVTNLVEQTKMKCLQYWVPVGGSKSFGKVIVYTDSEEEFAEFSVRRFKISYEGSELQREVVHYIYTAWPDKDIPRSTSSLLHFWQKVRKHDKDKSKPWLVHCSAGVGRTGTFVALDYLYDQGIDTGYVDVNTCVRTLREQRVNMVQMKEQYKYLYRVMVEALVLRSTPVLLDEFSSHYADLLTTDRTTGKTKLEMDYQSMVDEEVLVTHHAGQKFEEDMDLYSNAKKTENKSKNRYSNILASDEYRPFLSTHVPGTNNYINAVYMPELLISGTKDFKEFDIFSDIFIDYINYFIVPDPQFLLSYSDLHGYIIAQTPLADTAVDCCRLVIEQEIHVIVTFDDDGDDEVGVYLPTAGSVEIGPFKVTLDSEQKRDGYVIRRHTFTFKSKEQTVVQIVYKNWGLHTLVPKEPQNMLQMLQEVEELMRQFDNKPVLTQCRNGAERSGLFVVLMNAIDRARTDEEISIPQVIRFLRIRRQQIIPNYEQYKFCHDVILAYADSNSMYANM